MWTRTATFFDGAFCAGLGWLWTEKLRACGRDQYLSKSRSENSRKGRSCGLGQLTLASSFCVSSKYPESEAFTSR